MPVEKLMLNVQEGFIEVNGKSGYMPLPFAMTPGAVFAEVAISFRNVRTHLIRITC